MGLTRTAIVAAALSILDDYGLGDLSMRRIAAALGAAPAALYWHYPSKQDLLAGLATEMLAGLSGPPQVTRTTLTQWSCEFRDRLLAHRDGADLVASVLSMRLLEVSPVDTLAGSFIHAGYAPPVAESAAALVVHFVLGHTLDRQGYAQSRRLGVAGPPGQDAEETFRFGIGVIVTGLLND